MAAIIQYTKGHSVQITPHFRSTDFDCRCKRPGCQVTLISQELAQGLEALRGFAGPLTIASGFRCPAHNREIGGAVGSYHLSGMAADPHARQLTGAQLAAYAESVLCFARGGIGIYATFCHTDVRGVKARWDGTTKVRIPC